MTKVPGPTPQRPRRKRRSAWLIFGIVALIVIAALLIAAEILARRAMPILRARVIDTLSTQFDSRVELAQFNISVLNGLEVTGTGLKLYPRQLATLISGDQPLVSVGAFRFRTRWEDLLRSPMHIRRVDITDLGLYRPTAEQRRQLAADRAAHAQTAKHNRIDIYVDELLIDRATIRLASDRPDKAPLEFDIRSVDLEDVSAGRPMRFHALLLNPKPIGNIDSSGSFGPFDVHAVGNTPVSGTYTFTHADLSSIKGIGGMLSSTGSYAGRLDNIAVDGTTDTPNFSLDISGSRPVPLRTKFHAIVDGVNGDTYLQPVEATLGRSHILARGQVVRVPLTAHGDSDTPAAAAAGPDSTVRFGRRVELDVTVAPAEIADMLRLAVRTNPPIMHGALNLTTSFDLPPGPGTVAERMRLKGRFSIRDATFSNEKIQNRVEQLSLRGQGRPDDAKYAAQSAAAGQPVPKIPSQMSGTFTLENASLNFSDLDYNVPGADIAVTGVYSLDGNRFDFHGLARLHAKVSEMVTGWKALLLMPFNGLFAKHGAGTEIGFTVSGTKSDPKFGLDLFHKPKLPQSDSQQSKPR